MFTSLDEQMKHDDAIGISPKERILKWAMVTLASVVLSGGIYYAIQMLA